LQDKKELYKVVRSKKQGKLSTEFARFIFLKPLVKGAKLIKL